jgi:hypothetical protein
MTNGTSSHVDHHLPPPLRTAPDMRLHWDDVELSFDEAAERIIASHAADGVATDLPITDLKTWAVAPYEGQFALVPLTRHHPPKALRSNGFAGLMTRIGAPAEFIRGLPAPLALANVNYLMSEHDDRFSVTLRLRGEEVSAVVSDKYAPLDIEELVEGVRDALSRFDLLRDVRVRGVSSGLVDNMRLILPSEEVAVKVGDVSYVGLDVTTSSFSRSAVRLVPTAWRLVCQNGLRAPERRGELQLSFRHSGDVERLRSGIMEAIPSALAHARGLMKQWQRAVNFMVEDVAKQIEAMRELTIPERKGLETELVKETGAPTLPDHVPLYDLVNAMTASAKAAVPARRLELEAMAGELLDRHVGRGS